MVGKKEIYERVQRVLVLLLRNSAGDLTCRERSEGLARPTPRQGRSAATALPALRSLHMRALLRPGCIESDHKR